jgi:hypothetical protein
VLTPAKTNAEVSQILEVATRRHKAKCAEAADLKKGPVMKIPCGQQGKLIARWILK